jgi:hypothetical protein
MVYLWRDGTSNPNWPGEKATYVGLDGEFEVYAVTVDLTEFDRIIFNDNKNTHKTPNLELTTTTTGFTANGSSYIYAG